MCGELGTSSICLVSLWSVGRRIFQLHNCQHPLVFEFAPFCFPSLFVLPIVVVEARGPKYSMAAASESTAWRSLASLPSAKPRAKAYPAGYFADSKMTSLCLVWLRNLLTLNINLKKLRRRISVNHIKCGGPPTWPLAC